MTAVWWAAAVPDPAAEGVDVMAQATEQLLATITALLPYAIGAGLVLLVAEYVTRAVRKGQAPSLPGDGYGRGAFVMRAGDEEHVDADGGPLSGFTNRQYGKGRPGSGYTSIECRWCGEEGVARSSRAPALMIRHRKVCRG